MRRLRTLLTITSIRLSLAYTLIFGLVAVAIVFYMTASTTSILRRQLAESVALEVIELGAVYERGGINSLMRTLERNASAPGAKLYVVADSAGRIIAGNVQDIDTGVIDHLGWTDGGFGYTRFEDQTGNKYKAIAQVIELPNGMRLLVGRDLGEPERFREVVGRALAISLGAMVITGLLTWILMGRSALKRLDEVSRSSSRILAGDRRERLPVSGVGDEFDRLSISLNTMLDRIGSLEVGLRHVSDNIAHDLKTPLTRLRNKADQALAGRQAGRDYRAVLQEVIEDTDGIITTFDALLMIARVESGSSAAQLDPVDLSQIAVDMAELYQPVAEDAGFSFATAIESGIEVTGNRELLSRALANLVDNALKYGKPAVNGARVEVSLSKNKGWAILCVADGGPGIAPQDYSRVTERFSRLEESRSEAGSGLGLSLVSAVAKLHGGTLEFGDGDPGLRACIRLPLEQDATH
jgi:signal transduction histidine kinase